MYIYNIYLYRYKRVSIFRTSKYTKMSKILRISYADYTVLQQSVNVLCVNIKRVSVTFEKNYLI